MKISCIQNLFDKIRGKNPNTVTKLNWFIRKIYKKIFNKPINIVFVCYRPAIWSSLKTIFDECTKDKKFNVFLVAIPKRVNLPIIGMAHEQFISEGAEDFFVNYPCHVINGYDYNSKKWFDIKQIRPDYVFFQQPYNIIYPAEYQSNVVRKYAKILYVHYGMLIFKGLVQESVYPKDFFKNVSIVFTENKSCDNSFNETTRNSSYKPRTFITGYTRFDYYKSFKDLECDNWNFSRSKHIFRIIWTPRWCTNEGTCTFFDYKDKLFNYVCSNHDIDFIFRPHPQAFEEWNQTGEFPKKEADLYKLNYKNSNNAKIDDQQEYLSTFYSSDLLITDISSVIPEYMLSGKPIIYCHKQNHFNDTWDKIAKECFYWVKNWTELQDTIEMLKSGNDPLKDGRINCIKREFYFPKNSSGYTIKEIIKEDFNLIPLYRKFDIN